MSHGKSREEDHVDVHGTRLLEHRGEVVILVSIQLEVFLHARDVCIALHPTRLARIK